MHSFEFFFPDYKDEITEEDFDKCPPFAKSEMNCLNMCWTFARTRVGDELSVVGKIPTTSYSISEKYCNLTDTSGYSPVSIAANYNCKESSDDDAKNDDSRKSERYSKEAIECKNKKVFRSLTLNR